jgi:phosphoribosyl 1,2-cyclic phosphodiesterase
MADIAPATVDDVVLSHGHRDHVLGAAAGARIYGWRVWATLGTVWQWRALRHVGVRPFEPGDSFDVPPFRIHSAPTPHDVADSSAVVVEVPATGVRVGYCTDLGHAPAAVRDLLLDLDLLILESNYDRAMLAAGPYGPELQARVSGDHGHLGNEQAAALLGDVAGARLRHVVLAHISRHNNTPDRALQAASDALAATAFRGTIAVAPQDAVLGPMLVPAPAAASFSGAERGATFPP